MRTRILVSLTATLLLAAGCGAAAKPTTAKPSPSPSSAPAANAIAVGTVMSLDLPSGWVALRGLPVTGGPRALCLQPRGATRGAFGCPGVKVYYGDHLPGAEMNTYAPNVADGWYSATDVQPCPIGKVSAGGYLNGVQTQPGLAQGIKPVGDHKADWNQWSATCQDGSAFKPQAWFLPESKVVIFDYTGHAETAAILASAKFSADGAALPAMPTYLAGHVKSATATSITVQPFSTYGNDAQGKAYASAHGLMYPFADDYYDADFGPVRTIALTGSTGCTGNVELAGDDNIDTPIACDRFTGARVGLPVGFWLKAGTSTAESAFEIFRP